MKTKLVLTLLLTVICSATSWAAPKKKNVLGSEHKIFEVSALSISITAGAAGDTHESFKITDSTKITLNGVPTHARDLKAGMIAKIATGSDKETATSIEAKDPPKHPGKK